MMRSRRDIAISDDGCDAENVEVSRILADSHPPQQRHDDQDEERTHGDFHRRSCPIGYPGYPEQGPSTVENKPDMNRLSRWGVGPSIVLAALSYAAIGAIMTYLWPDTYLIRAIPYPVFLVTGGSLLVIGVHMLIVAAVALTRNYDRDQLATRGIYGGSLETRLLGVDRVSDPRTCPAHSVLAASPYTLGGVPRLQEEDRPGTSVSGGAIRGLLPQVQVRGLRIAAHSPAQTIVSQPGESAEPSFLSAPILPLIRRLIMFDPDFCELRCPICTGAEKRQQDRPDVPGDRDGCHFRGMPIRSSETEEVRRAAQRACVLDTTGAGIRRSVIWPKGYQSDEQRAFRVGIPGDGTVGHPGPQPAFVGLEEAGLHSRVRCSMPGAALVASATPIRSEKRAVSVSQWVISPSLLSGMARRSPSRDARPGCLPDPAASVRSAPRSIGRCHAGARTGQGGTRVPRHGIPPLRRMGLPLQRGQALP